MDIIWLVIALLAVAAVLGALTRTVHGDGLGHREPPRSHLHEADRTPTTQVFSR